MVHTQRINRFEGIFLTLAGALLCLTAFAKLYSTLGTARVLDRPDDLLLLSNRTVLFSVGLIEIAVVALLLSSRSARIKLLTVLWLSSMFLLYRGARWYYEIPGPCSCLGSLTEKLRIKAEIADLILAVVALYLWVGSALLLVIHHLRRDRPPEGKSADAPRSDVNPKLRAEIAVADAKD